MRKINSLDYLFVITILFFVIGMINISLSVLGLICFILPFAMAYIAKRKIWCQKYCPRSSLFVKVFGKISLKKTPPKWVKKPVTKKVVVSYFIVNMLIIIMSSIMVGIGRVSPIDHVRMLFFFKLPFALPQLINQSLSPVITHLGYRIYSMMLTSTLFGIVLSILYLPRTWCIICPVQTLTSAKIFKPKLEKQ